MKRNRLVIERLENRRLMVADWTNADNALDVNDSGLVTPLDVLLVANDINLNGVRELPALASGSVAPTFVDVNGDQLASALDALQIVNALNFYVDMPSVSFTNASTDSPGSQFVGQTVPGNKVLVEQLAAVLPAANATGQ